MKRREFLQAGALAGAAAGVPGCAAFDLRPPSDAFLPQSMTGFLGNLDGAMKYIFAQPLPAPPELSATVGSQDPYFARAETLSRKAMGALMLAGSFHDLSPENQAHPGMQARLGAGMGLFDEAVLGMNGYLGSLAPTERRDVSRALQKDPGLGMRIIGKLDAEASAAGVPLARRTQLRTLGAQVCNRLTQSPGMLIDEYAVKVERVSARSASGEEIERQAVATMGREAFLGLKQRLATAQQKWSVVLTDAPATGGTGPELTPPPPPPSEDQRLLPQEQAAPAEKNLADPDAEQDQVSEAEQEKLDRAARARRGTILLTVGGILLSVGVVVLVPSLFFSAGGAGLSRIGWWFGATVGAILSLGGIVCLIIGAVQKARS